jgi:chromosome segregation ATPase
VYEDFSKIKVPLVNPRRLSPKVLARFEKKYVDNGYTEKRKEFAENLAKTHPLTVYYDNYTAAVNKRNAELSAAAAGRIKEINAEVDALKDRKSEIDREISEARKNDEAYNKLVAELRPKQQEVSKKMNEIQASYPGYKEARVAEAEASHKRNELRKKAEAELKKEPDYIALEERIKEQREKIHTAPQGSSERRKLEEDLNHNMQRERNEMVNRRHAKLPGVRELELERLKVQGHREQLDRAIRVTAEYRKLNQENQSLGVQMRYKPDPKLVAERKRLDQDISEIPRREIGYAKAAAAAESNPLEAQLLRQSYSPVKLASTARKVLSENLPHAPDDIWQIKRAKALQSLPWPTSVDWDGMAKYEKDKEAMTQPVMQHYLKRMKPWMYE